MMLYGRQVAAPVFRSFRRSLTALVTFAALAATAGCASQQAVVGEIVHSGKTDVVVAPDWTVGSWWAYSDGYGLTVESNRGGVALFRRLDDEAQWFTRRGFLRELAQSATTYREIVFRTVLPEAGRQLVAGEPLTFRREYAANGELIRHATSWTVEGRERIAVPAGEFDCWIIVMRTRSISGDWTGFERWWYSPEAQHYVRMEFQYGNMPVASRVLVDYQVATGQLATGHVATGQLAIGQLATSQVQTGAKWRPGRWRPEVDFGAGAPLSR